MWHKIKQTVSKIPLVCVLSFVLGTYVMFLIDYFYFESHLKNEQVSTFIAAFALLFSIIAAIKLEAWSEKHLNEKAFKQTEKFIELLSQLRLHNVELRVQHGKLVKIDLHKEREKLNTVIKLIDDIGVNIAGKMVESLALTYTFPMWHCKLSDNAKDLFERIATILTQTQDDITKVNNLARVHLAAHAASKKIKELNQVLIDTDSLFDEFFKLSYNDCFIHYKPKSS